MDAPEELKLPPGCPGHPGEPIKKVAAARGSPEAITVAIGSRFPRRRSGGHGGPVGRRPSTGSLGAPIVIVGALLLVSVVGALQVRQNDRLSERGSLRTDGRCSAAAAARAHSPPQRRGGLSR